MMNRHTQYSKASRCLARKNGWSGFSMLELLIALAVFVIIGGAAVSLFQRHVPIFGNQQSQVALNFGLRNAATQMQLDVSNAGNGFYQGPDTAGWPLGITVVNQVFATGCWNSSTFVYTPSCFDTLNVIAADRATPASHPSNSTGSGVLTDTTTDLYLTPVPPTTLPQLAADYKTGDQILLVTSNGLLMTTAKLTADGVISGAYVHLVHGKTNSNGTNSPANDTYSISTNGDVSATPQGLTNSFVPADWVLKLDPITYTVDASTDPTNPKLMRNQVFTSTHAATSDVIAEQIIGFKVGVSFWNGLSGSASDDTGDATTLAPYSYSNTAASTATINFTRVRAVRISIIGRTPPNSAFNFHNTFDGGPYKIDGISVVVNPRNLSMKD